MTLSPPSAFLPPTSLTSGISTALPLQTPIQPPFTHLLIAETTSTATQFEPQLPDPTLLIGMGSVLLLSVAAAFVWANEVVPVSRTKLAISKKSGQVKEYLDGLDASVVESRSTEEDATITTAPTNDGRNFERWLFSDWLNSPSRRKASSRGGGRQKEPALPILKNANWNSGDNPVLVTAAIMMVGIVVASVTERVL